MLARELQHPVREIIYRTSGQTHGPITRLMSPSDLGELLKPFVFLDLAGFDDRFAPTPMGFGWHPHSGIETVTVMLEGAVRYAETTGNEGVLPPGGVEWMRAGNGVWHTGAPEQGRVKAFQLWVALPPALENAGNASCYVMPKDVPVEGPVRVILGEYRDAKSPIAAPPMSYLAVSLGAGERWTYHPPKGHTVAWVAVHEGVLRTSGRRPRCSRSENRRAPCPSGLAPQRSADSLAAVDGDDHPDDDLKAQMVISSLRDRLPIPQSLSDQLRALLVVASVQDAHVRRIGA